MIYRVALKHVRESGYITVRELSCEDELSVADVYTEDAIHLLNRVIVQHPQKECTRAETLATADRDRLLTHLYMHSFGPTINTSVTCGFCKSLFDVSFSLDDFLRHTEEDLREVVTAKPDDGYFHLGKWAFRLPTGEDELAVAALPLDQAESALLHRCVVNPSGAVDSVEIQQAMNDVAPLMQNEMTARCPECSQEQVLFFDIQSYFLAKLVMNKRVLSSEIHLLARCYKGWRYSEILELPRSLRKMYLDCIEAEFRSDSVFK